MKDIAYAILRPDNSITYSHMKIDENSAHIVDRLTNMIDRNAQLCCISDDTLLVMVYGCFGDFNQTATDLMGFALYGTCILCKLSLKYALSDMYELTNESFDSLEISDLVEALYQIDHMNKGIKA